MPSESRILQLVDDQLSNLIQPIYLVVAVVMVFVTDVEMDESQLNIVANVKEPIAHWMLTPAF